MTDLHLHMKEPIWVWCYDFGLMSHPEFVDRPTWKDMPHVLPQAHTYAFRSEEEARKHPEAMKWKKDHKYVLQKVYLN